MKTIRTRIILITISLIAIIGAGSWIYITNQPAAEPQPQVVEQKKSANRTEISYDAKPGITSLEQLMTEASEVVVTESEYGKLVDSIEGHKGGTDGKYWSFYVNGEMAQVGAGTYIQKQGDKIEWKFQKL